MTSIRKFCDSTDSHSNPWMSPSKRLPGIVSLEDKQADQLPDKTLSRKLEYGVATPGTMATTGSSMFSPEFSLMTPSTTASPLGIFTNFALSSSRTLFQETAPSFSSKENNTSNLIDYATTEEKSLIDMDEVDEALIDQDMDDDNDTEIHDDKSIASSDPTRIGIEPTDYQIPEGDIPISPIEPFFKHKKNPKQKKPESEHDSDDELWQLKLIQHTDTLQNNVIPEEEEYPPNDSSDRFLHTPTANGRFLFNSRPMNAPMRGMKYCLSEGKAAMSKLHRLASDSKLLAPKTRPNISARRHSSASEITSQSSISSKVVTSTATEVATFKIFILLVAPRNKIFEIIQVFYPPLETTVQVLLDSIPANATEPVLGSQTYIGLCRKNGQHLHADMLASAAAVDLETYNECAKIVRGEILVAIPKGFSALFCSRIAEPILSNPRVVKLLRKSDPLAPHKKKKRKKGKDHDIKEHKYKAIEVKPSKVNGMPNPYSSSMLQSIASNNDDYNPLDPPDQSRWHDTNESMLGDHITFETAVGTENQSTVVLTHEHLHVPLEIWQTKMSLRSDSSSSSSVDASILSSHRANGISSSNLPHQENPSPILEGAVECPTLGLDLEMKLVPYSSEISNAHGVTALSPQPMEEEDEASPVQPNQLLSNLQTSLQNNDVTGAIEVFGKILSGMSSSTESEEQQNILFQHLVMAMKQNQMDR
jgi:hypothetical protein